MRLILNLRLDDTAKASVLRKALAAALCLAAVFAIPSNAQVQSPATLSLEDRAMMASRIYRIVSAFFPGLSQEKFDAAYASYLGKILRTDDRREFDLASMEFIADLHDGHSWFYDTWLDQTYAQPTGFLAYPLGGQVDCGA
jgi:hypothetical protein